MYIYIYVLLSSGRRWQPPRRSCLVTLIFAGRSFTAPLTGAPSSSSWTAQLPRELAAAPFRRGMLRLETLIELRFLDSSCSSRVVCLIQGRQTVIYRAIRANGISVDRIIPPSYSFNETEAWDRLRLASKMASVGCDRFWFSALQRGTYTHTHIDRYIYIYMCIHTHMCVYIYI